MDALPRLVREFQVRPETVALGGIVRIANGSTVEAGQVTEARTPRQLLVNLQIVEYLRAFLVGRTGWSRIGALLIVSGAFGIFRREEVVGAGGYDPDSLRRRTPSWSSGFTSSAASAGGRTGSASSPTRSAGPRRRTRCARCAPSATAGSAACSRCCGTTAA